MGEEGAFAEGGRSMWKGSGVGESTVTHRSHEPGDTEKGGALW